MTLIAACCWVAAFLIGGIPFGYLVGRCVLKDDIRNHGSGNIGATNVARVLGWKWGGLVLLLDAAKGFLPTALTGSVLQHFDSSTNTNNAVVVSGICTILGHMYPVYLKLRGGKGVATALGVISVIAPVATTASLMGFLIAVAATRIVALASIVAATCFLMVQAWLLRKTAIDPDVIGLSLFSVAVPSLIIWRHRANIVRMIKGTEPRFGKRVAVEDSATSK
jgi:acyl phosphate:glycerol-3-phosphate acyltransferase